MMKFYKGLRVYFFMSFLLFAIFFLRLSRSGNVSIAYWINNDAVNLIIIGNMVLSGALFGGVYLLYRRIARKDELEKS